QRPPALNVAAAATAHSGLPGRPARALLRGPSRSREYNSYSGKIHTLKWSSDGSRLATGSVDRVVNLFSLDSGRLSKDVTFKGHTGTVLEPAPPSLLATASSDKSLRLWDARTQHSVATLVLRGENINVTWSPNGECIAVGNKEDLVSFVDVKTRKEQFKLEVNEVSWNCTGDAFFMTTGLGSVQAHPTNCICLDFDRTGRYFATGAADALVTIWSATELAPLAASGRLEWPVRTISFSHDGQLLAAGSEDHFIDISHSATGEQVLQHATNNSSFTLAWHPRCYLLAYGADRDKYHDARDAACVKTFSVAVES
uniref:WD_REPEATS_REGION domain-containing protein n=1 Tax=Macrostomum lignano TaxID=282301 RepID=A0A1I8FNM3_9PLAT